MASSLALTAPALAQDAPPPNIVVIMGDDIGWSNIGVYNQGIMAGRTPHLDQLANEGMRFTDYYAEASCTAGRVGVSPGTGEDGWGPGQSPSSLRRRTTYSSSSARTASSSAGGSYSSSRFR